MTYSVKEIYKTLQGEGSRTGRSAVFCRFAGCNLWSGRERDRATASCTFCDTDFIGTDGTGGGQFLTPHALSGAVARAWGEGRDCRYVVLTGGEPLLQIDPELIAALKAQDFEVAVETNGTIELFAGLDWICVSPKAGSPLQQRRGDELKLVYPQPGLEPSELRKLDFQHFWLQPTAGPRQAENIAAAISYCLANPPWRLSLQTHKLIGIP